MRALGHFPVTLDLLLPAHITGACYPAPLRVALALIVAAVIAVIVVVVRGSKI